MNVFRGLILNEEVSFTLIDTTAIVNEGLRLHKLTPPSGYLFGKALSALAFFSACLKEDKGEISLSLQSGGKEFIGVSGNRALALRGYIATTNLQGLYGEELERAVFTKYGGITVIRDDGYSRPFVGSCLLPEGGTLDEGIEEYFRISEQLPTRIKTIVEINEGGRCAFAGVIALQPLPFAKAETLQTVADTDLGELLKKAKIEGAESLAKSMIGEGAEERHAAYKCNCSREYLSAVLITLGKEQLLDIIREEGVVRAHCHYCNTDYEFTGEDVEGLFQK